MSNQEIAAVAFCWYEPDEWERLTQTATDKEIMDDTYEEWRSNANEAISNGQAQGHRVHKVAIKIDQLTAWCEEKGVENNGKARSEYAAELLRQRESKKSTLRA